MTERLFIEDASSLRLSFGQSDISNAKSAKATLESGPMLRAVVPGEKIYLSPAETPYGQRMYAVSKYMTNAQFLFLGELLNQFLDWGIEVAKIMIELNEDLEGIAKEQAEQERIRSQWSPDGHIVGDQRADSYDFRGGEERFRNGPGFIF